MDNLVRITPVGELVKFPTVAPTDAPKPKKKVVRGKPHEAVEPIKDLADIEAAKQYFLSQSPKYKNDRTNLRNYMMFVVNINNALRIGDLLSLKIGDVLDKNLNVVDKVYLRESKTGKTRYCFFGKASKEAIMMYLTALGRFDTEDYLFTSENKKGGTTKPITRQRAWEIIHSMGLAISEGREKQLHLGTHSMRKTFGYQKIKANPDDPMVVATVSEMYNHSSMSTTYRYLGIDAEEKEKFCTEHEL